MAEQELTESTVKGLAVSNRIDYKLTLAEMLGIPQDKRRFFLLALQTAEKRGYADAINDVANKLASWERPK